MTLFKETSGIKGLRVYCCCCFQCQGRGDAMKCLSQMQELMPSIKRTVQLGVQAVQDEDAQGTVVKDLSLFVLLLNGKYSKWFLFLLPKMLMKLLPYFSDWAHSPYITAPPPPSLFSEKCWKGQASSLLNLPNSWMCCDNWWKSEFTKKNCTSRLPSDHGLWASGEPAPPAADVSALHQDQVSRGRRRVPGHADRQTQVCLPGARHTVSTHSAGECSWNHLNYFYRIFFYWVEDLSKFHIWAFHYIVLC